MVLEVQTKPSEAGTDATPVLRTLMPNPDSLCRMGTLKQVVVDCRHPARLARFWADALDGFEVLAYDDVEIARLAELGLTPETGPCVIVIGPGLELGFQQVDVEDVARKPLHLDLSAASRESEVERLVRLGASVKQEFDDHTWLLDPEGNDFCVTDNWERT